MKEIILVRGASGAGKTSFVKSMMILAQMDAQEVPMNVIVDEISADKYFYNDKGEYVFNPKELSHAHAFCQSVTCDFVQTVGEYELESGETDVKHVIFIHNTFTRDWEMKPYEDLAKSIGYTIRHIIVENRHESDSVHDVPKTSIEDQKERFEVCL